MCSFMAEGQLRDKHADLLIPWDGRAHAAVKHADLLIHWDGRTHAAVL